MSDGAIVEYDDPMTKPFWDAAREKRLLLQHCLSCGHYQFYPRPFCMACDGEDLVWSQSSGQGKVYSMTTVHIRVIPDLDPPYRVGVIELAEGPRVTSCLVGEYCAIGDDVLLRWRDRHRYPPLPVFQSVGTSNGHAE